MKTPTKKPIRNLKEGVIASCDAIEAEYIAWQRALRSWESKSYDKNVSQKLKRNRK